MGKKRNAPLVLGFVALLGLMLFIVSPSFGQSRNTIVVTGADTVREESSVQSTTLETKLDGVVDRVVIRQANKLIEMLLAPLPVIFSDKLDNMEDRIVMQSLNTAATLDLVTNGALATKLDDVKDRVVTRFPNTLQRFALVAVPSDLQTQLDNLEDRVVMRHVNTNKKTLLQRNGLASAGGPAYENIPPVVTNVSLGTGTNAVTIQWSTDEFATSKVEYGTQPGVYTSEVGSNQYATSHLVSFTPQARTQAATYYYRVVSIDLSGNATFGAESSFEFTVPTAVQLRSFVTSSTLSPLLLVFVVVIITGFARCYTWQQRH